MAIDTEILKQANELMVTVAPGCEFQIRGSRLYVAGKGIAKCCIIEKQQGMLFTFRSTTFGWGFTQTTTVNMLARWILGKPRYPARALGERWGHWLRDELEKRGYDIPGKIECVLCGAPYSGNDWWNGDGDKNGPCCQYGKCQSKT